jgi:hypothetical protein
MKRPLLIALAGAFALLASLAHAQPKPALVQDRDEPGRNFYQERVQRNDCGGENTCALFFPPVPANSRLVITQISMFASLDDSDARLFVRVGTQADPWLVSFALPGPGYARMAMMPMTAYFTSSQQPRVEFSSGGFADATVSTTLTGYWIQTSP